MNKESLDLLYHNLRELCVSDDIQQKEAVLGLTTHLLSPHGDYTGLLRFLSYYGVEYLLQEAIELLSLWQISPPRIVELGAGFGWLGRGLSHHFKCQYTAVDKRQWVGIDVVADIETIQGMERVLDILRPDDLVVASQLLHCLDDPVAVMSHFRHNAVLALEYRPSNDSYWHSYRQQIRKFGCRPVDSTTSCFPSRTSTASDVQPYVVWLAIKGEK